MTTSFSSHAANPERQILSCRHGQRLIGHILERNGQHYARSRLDEILIGIFASRAEALAAIAHAAHLDALEDGAHEELTLLPCQPSANLDDVADQMLEIINRHRMRETFALFRYLSDRGFHPDEHLLLVEDALQQYAYEQP
jgi:hypothetical protein